MKVLVVSAIVVGTTAGVALACNAKRIVRWVCENFIPMGPMGH